MVGRGGSTHVNGRRLSSFFPCTCSNESSLLHRTKLKVAQPPMLRKLFLGCGIALIVVAALLLAFPVPFLRVAHPPARCDVIVLLGGATGERDPVAAKLYHAGFAPRIIVTGNGDCVQNVRALAAHGVSTNAILVECESRSTKENAEAVARIAREHGFTNAIIVTSWFHSRRALATFHTFAPKLRVQSAVSDVRSPFRYEWRTIAAEYFKIVCYAVRWHVPPWT